MAEIKNSIKNATIVDKELGTTEKTDREENNNSINTEPGIWETAVPLVSEFIKNDLKSLVIYAVAIAIVTIYMVGTKTSPIDKIDSNRPISGIGLINYYLTQNTSMVIKGYCIFFIYDYDIVQNVGCLTSLSRMGLVVIARLAILGSAIYLALETLWLIMPYINTPCQLAITLIAHAYILLYTFKKLVRIENVVHQAINQHMYKKEKNGEYRASNRWFLWTCMLFTFIYIPILILFFKGSYSVLVHTYTHVFRTV